MGKNFARPLEGRAFCPFLSAFIISRLVDMTGATGITGPTRRMNVTHNDTEGCKGPVGM